MSLSSFDLIIILISLIFVSSFFSGSEIGMMSINRYRLKHLVKKQHRAALRVSQMLSRPDRLLSVILIGNTLANIIASTVTTIIAQRLYGDTGVAIGTILLTLIILVFAEMTPKILAAMYPQKVAFLASLPLLFLQYLFSPLVYVTSLITKGILAVFGIKLTRANVETLSGDELRTIVHEGGGFLPVEHKGMLLGLLDLEQATVEDIMVLKTDIVGINLDLPLHQLKEQLETAQHTRLPIYHGSIEDIIGLVHLRSVLHLLLEDELSIEKIKEIAESPYFIPEGTALNTQILQFQKMKQRSCFVVDEYGELQGLVTLEDILEEIVGEFTTDMAQLSRGISEQEDGTVIIDASNTLRLVNRALNWDLPSLGPKTVSGLIIEYLGYIPPADCCLMIKEYQIEILKVGEKKIESVKMLKKMEG